MFIRQDKTTAAIDAEIFRCVQELSHHPVHSKPYSDILDLIAGLQKRKELETKRRPTVSPDTMVLAVTNLLGIVMITRYERENVITSKATGFVQKLNKPKP